MAQFHPSVRPDFLAEKLRDAEREVWESLRKLDNSWHVFYSARENSESGYDREIDFILIRLNRIFYCEVKGGVVKVNQRAGPGVFWEHSKRSGEPIKKRVDPQQLLKARTALNATIRNITGATPYELGFLEHNFYIFPHTSRRVTEGTDLERGVIHYAFAEDMTTLPQRLRQIVDSKTGVYIHPDKIEGLIASLDGMVIKGGSLPDLSAEVRPMSAQSTPGIESEAISVPQSRLSWKRSSAATPGSSEWLAFSVLKRVLLRRWRYTGLGIAGLYLLYLILPYVEPAQPAPSSKTVAASSAPSSSSSGVSPRAGVNKSPETQSQGKKAMPAVAEHPESALPIFIPKAALTDVEQAVMLARQINERIIWRTGSYHGSVTLYEIENGRCLRHRITRNDVTPIDIGFTRRCH